MIDHEDCGGKIHRSLALSKALSSISKGKRFPRKVFVGTWLDYVFFDPSVLFEEDLISIKDFLLRHNNDRVMALVNLGNRSDQRNSDVMFLEKSTTWNDYLARLVGDGSALNWMFLMDRYVCASDRGNWAIYCEKENDLAALAVREDFSSSTLLTLTAQLKGRSIRVAFSSTDKHSFLNRIIPAWKLILSSEYDQSAP